jgi:hypothetical protein
MARRESRRLWVRMAGCAALVLSIAGCSLLSFKSPERPLSTRDLNARILTRQLAAEFATAVGRCAEDIAGTESDPALLDDSLRWEIAAVAESRRAATQVAPMMSLLDTWAFSAQMKSFLADGAAGGSLFGTHQKAVRAVADNYADGAAQLAQRLMAPREFAEYQSFVAGYVREHPLQDLKFARASVIELWSREKGADVKLVDSLGTIPEAMADAAERMQIYGDTVPTQLMRTTQLALRESGYSKEDVRSELTKLDERLARLSAVAESAPGLLHEAIAEVRHSLREVIDHFDASSSAATQALRTERTALVADIQSEREAVVAAVDVQRKALALDAAKIADQVVKSSGQQVRYLAGEVLLLLIILAVIVLGLPFAAGYLVGRARHARRGAP